MLREGWDVQNVTVIVGLRPYTAKANILPEQTIGRGLRLMFAVTSATYTERVDVIGNPAFLKFVEQLEKRRGHRRSTPSTCKEPLVITTIAPDPEQARPRHHGPGPQPDPGPEEDTRRGDRGHRRRAADVPASAEEGGRRRGTAVPLRGRTTSSPWRSSSSGTTPIPEPQTAEEVISYYAKRIAQDVKLPSQFAALVPKVREFLRDRAFGETGRSRHDKAMIKAIATSVAQYVTVKTFATALRGLVVEELSPDAGASRAPALRDRALPVLAPDLRGAQDRLQPRRRRQRVRAASSPSSSRTRPTSTSFAKLPRRFGFAIEYTDSATNLRYYEPDFVAVDTDGGHYLIETKGQENIDVAHKDRAATIWCENATLLTGSAMALP